MSTIKKVNVNSTERDIQDTLPPQIYYNIDKSKIEGVIYKLLNVIPHKILMSNGTVSDFDYDGFNTLEEPFNTDEIVSNNKYTLVAHFNSLKFHSFGYCNLCVYDLDDKLLYAAILDGWCAIKLNRHTKVNICTDYEEVKLYLDFTTNNSIKTISILGDSLSIPEYQTIPKLESLGYKINNFGLSGTTISDIKENYFYTRKDDIDYTADAILVWGGLNDWVHGAPVGDIHTNSINDFSIFSSAFIKLIAYIKEKCTYMVNSPKLIVITPPHSQHEPTAKEYNVSEVITENKYSNGGTLREYVDAIKHICSIYSVPVIDIYNESGYSPCYISFRDLYTTDGVHPNAHGGLLLAKFIDSKLKLIVRSS